MQYRQMGSIDYQLSALGFGCMRLPTTRRFWVKTVDTKEAVGTIRMGIALCLGMLLITYFSITNQWNT